MIISNFSDVKYAITVSVRHIQSSWSSRICSPNISKSKSVSSYTKSYRLLGITGSRLSLTMLLINCGDRTSTLNGGFWFLFHHRRLLRFTLLRPSGRRCHNAVCRLPIGCIGKLFQCRGKQSSVVLRMLAMMLAWTLPMTSAFASVPPRMGDTSSLTFRMCLFFLCSCCGKALGLPIECQSFPCFLVLCNPH